MARSFKINVTNDKGQPIALVWCRAYKSTDNTEVETQYTDASGNATFVALTDNVDCYIIALWGTRSKFFFSEATIGTTEIDNLAITTAKIANLAVTDAKIDSLAVSKLTAGTITVECSFSGQILKLVSGAAYSYIWQSSNNFYIRNYNGNIQLQPATACVTKFLVGNLMPDLDNTLKCGISTAAWSEVHCYLLVDHTPILTKDNLKIIKGIKTETNGKLIPSSLPSHIYVPTEDKNKGTDGVNLGNLVGLTLGAIQELDQRIKALESAHV